MSTLIWNHQVKSYYIAISEWGYDIHEIVAVAIRLAQDRVPADAKPSALLIYRTESEELEPTGWDKKEYGPTWPEPPKPKKAKRGKQVVLAASGPSVKLVGLTTTHSLFVQRPRV
jgi:hypothetical protein